MTTTLTPTEAAPWPAAADDRPTRRGRAELVALAVLLVGTAALYLWNLSVSGWANEYYSGAVQAMTRDWTAFFFGSVDAGNTVTVDKPPAALWVMAASARIFGLSSWSILVPQALMGVGTVALLHAAVRRVAGPAAGLLAGAAMALTPVAVLMFRFNNPDALLVLLMVAAAYAVVRAVEHAGTRWLVLAGALIGLAFLTKTAQAFLVLPALALAYLWAAPTGLGRRVRQLLLAGAAVVVTGGWWFAVVDLWPTGSRPYIGGSTTDSALQLALGYNGLGRLFGAAAPGGAAGGGMPGGGSPFGGDAGPLRMFGASVGGQVSWLLPAAVALLVVGLLLTRRAPRGDRVRASLLLWGGWTVVTAAVFSLMSGTFHEYYTVALAPGIAALVGIGGAELWRRRDARGARGALAAVVAGTAAWAWVLLGRTPDVVPWLRWVVLAAALVGAAVLLLLPRSRRVAAAGLLAAVLATSMGPVAYAAETVATAHTSAIPLAGPETAGGGFGRGGGFGGMRGQGAPDGRGAPGAAAAAGGPRAEVADPALVRLLQQAGTTWSAATVSASSSASLALASGTDVMGMGGFSGSDPAPTLQEFQQLISAGRIRYYVEGGRGPGGVDPQQLLEQLPADVRDDPQYAGLITMAESGQLPGGFGGRGGTTSAITAWVQENFTAQEVGGRTVYDLAQPTG